MTFEIVQEAVAALFVALAGCMFWAAYQVKYKNRADLVRIGSGPLPGALLFKNQFATVHFVLGFASLVFGVLLVVLDNVQPAVWLFMGVSCAMAVRREMLIRAIEKAMNNGQACPGGES